MTETIKEIGSVTDFESFTAADTASTLVLFYSTASAKSLEAKTTLRNINTPVRFAAVNAAEVRDVHPRFGVTTVPTLLLLKEGRVTKKIEGIQSKSVYEAFISATPQRRADGTEAPPLRVTVYSTPTCPHCTTVKNYLRKNGIRYSDVDVSRDTRAGEELVRRSGSSGVPQTDINGTLVVGADMVRLSTLLGIRKN